MSRNFKKTQIFHFSSWIPLENTLNGNDTSVAFIVPTFGSLSQKTLGLHFTLLYESPNLEKSQ